MLPLIRPVVLALVTVTTATSTSAQTLADWPSLFYDRSGTVDRQRLTKIENELQQLPTPQVIPTGSRGYHSAFEPRPSAISPIMIDMYQERRIDSVLLAPASAEVAGDLVTGYGFPVAYRIDASLDGQTWSPIVNLTEDQPNPGTAPVTFHFEPVPARYIRITTLNPWEYGNGLYVVALAEFMAFDGEINRALNARVTALSKLERSFPWSPARLVDGFSDLGLSIDRTVTSPTDGYRCQPSEEDAADHWLQVDLGESRPIYQVDVIPAAPIGSPRADYGFPPDYEVRLSDDPEFRDNSVTVSPYGSRLITRPNANRSTIRTAAWPNSTARYVRIVINRLALDSTTAEDQYFFALSEIEVYEAVEPTAVESANDADVTADAERPPGQPEQQPQSARLVNVSTGRPVTASHPVWTSATGRWSVDALTDGFASQGRLIAVSDWIAKYERRNQRLAEKQVLDLAIAAGQRSARTFSAGLSATFACLVTLAAVSLLWRQKRDSLRRIKKLRKQIARDLHDEIGSSLASIRLLAEFSSKNPKWPQDARDNFADMHSAAFEAGEAMRDIVWLIDTEKASSRDLIRHLRAVANKMLPKHKLSFTDDAQSELKSIPIERRRAIVLAFKEALNNIRKHAKATEVEIHFSTRPRTFFLHIRDNGRGIRKRALEEIPLKNRKGADSEAAAANSPSSDGPTSDPPMTFGTKRIKHGLPNLIGRAEEAGGNCTIGRAANGGTELDWSITI